MSINSSIRWIGISASPFCAFYSIHLQQLLPDARVAVFITQKYALRAVKKLGTNISFPRLMKGLHCLTVAVFADAGRITNQGLLAYITGLLIGPLSINSTYHTLSWMSHKSKWPVRSIAAGEILAASESIDKWKTLKISLSILLQKSIRLIIIVDSKDLHTSLSPRLNSIDRSIRANVNCIWFES